MLTNKQARHNIYNYLAACKVGFQSFKRSYSQLTFFNFLQNYLVQAQTQRFLSRQRWQPYMQRYWLMIHTHVSKSCFSVVVHSFLPSTQTTPKQATHTSQFFRVACCRGRSTKTSNNARIPDSAWHVAEDARDHSKQTTA